MFIGRKKELSKLENLYVKGKFECIIIYGRRRVGKTTLIHEFIKDKDSIYFMGLESNAKENLEEFSKNILSLSSEFAEAETIFSGFDKAFETIFSISKERRIVVAIDEYPYLAAAYKGISSLLQKYIDTYHDLSKLFLILCGSSLSFMEQQVLGYQSPLYGRRTAQFKMNPFEFMEMKEFYQSFSMEELAIIYGITGGVPQYLTKINEKLSLEENIKQNFFDSSAYLFEEPMNLVKQECREPAQYNAIIRAIANGASRLSEIASKIGVESGLCSNYLTALISIGIVKKEFPFREESNRKTIYVLADSMFRFWYRFIPNHMTLIQKGASDMVYQRIEPQIPHFMGNVFEEICKEWLWQENLNGRLPITFSDLGRWWGTDKKKRKETEVDIIAFADEENAIFAECKWTKGLVDIEVLKTLEERSRLFHYTNVYLYIFSKSGFTKGCIEKAKEKEKIYLVSFKDMFSDSCEQ